MEIKKVIKFQIEIKRKMTREFQTFEFIDIIHPKWERNSSCVKEGPDDHLRGFYAEKDFVRSSKKLKKSDELIIRDIIINNDKCAVKVKCKQEIDWGYQVANDFFKEKNNSREIDSIFSGN